MSRKRQVTLDNLFKVPRPRLSGQGDDGRLDPLLSEDSEHVEDPPPALPVTGGGGESPASTVYDSTPSGDSFFFISWLPISQLRSYQITSYPLK